MVYGILAGPMATMDPVRSSPKKHPQQAARQPHAPCSPQAHRATAAPATATTTATVATSSGSASGSLLTRTDAAAAGKGGVIPRTTPLRGCAQTHTAPGRKTPAASGLSAGASMTALDLPQWDRHDTVIPIDDEEVAWSTLAILADEHGCREVRGFVQQAVQFLEACQAHVDRQGRQIPQLPKTAKQAARLQAQVDQWLQQGQTWQAYPVQCVLAVYGLWTRPEHADTLRAVVAVTDSLYQGDDGSTPVDLWLLPRWVKHYGHDHSDTRRLVRQAADALYRLGDPRVSVDLTRTVTELAQQLPGGLGWGSTVVAPVPDEEAFHRHAFMQSKAADLYDTGHYKVARDMYERCVAYYDTLGEHWLATARKIQSMRGINLCRLCMSDDDLTTESLVRATKRLALRELGPNHRATQDAVWLHGVVLLVLRRYEQANSVFQQSIRVRQSILGASHVTVLQCQVCGRFPKREGFVDVIRHVDFL